MEAMTADEFQNVGTLLKEAVPQAPRLINGFVKAGRKYQPLLKEANVRAVTVPRESTEFVAETPILIRRIDVVGRDTAKIAEGLSLKLRLLDGSLRDLAPKNTKLVLADGTTVSALRYQVDAVGKSLIAKSTLSIRALKLTSVRISGYSLDQFEAISEKVARTIDLSTRLDTYVSKQQDDVLVASEAKAALEKESAEIKAEVERLEDNQNSLQNEIASLVQEEAKSKAAKLAVEQALADARSSLEAVKNNEAQLREDVASLNKDIANKKSALNQLINDRNLISDEYKDYVAEGKQQSAKYAWFLYYAITIIAVCSWQLYAGATRILDAKPDGLTGLLTLSLQRLPFAAALALIVTVAWKLAAVFVDRIMTIHAQRLALARLLVIAKDTVYSSTSGLSISDEQKFRERIRLKLDMLRGHLTSELGRDFAYRPELSEASQDSTKAEVDQGLARAAAVADMAEEP